MKEAKEELSGRCVGGSWQRLPLPLSGGAFEEIEEVREVLGEHVRWVERDIHRQWYKLDRFVMREGQRHKEDKDGGWVYVIGS